MTIRVRTMTPARAEKIRRARMEKQVAHVIRSGIAIGASRSPSAIAAEIVRYFDVKPRL